MLKMYYIYKVKVLYNFVGEKGTYRANGKANVVFFLSTNMHEKY